MGRFFFSLFSLLKSNCIRGFPSCRDIQLSQHGAVLARVLVATLKRKSTLRPRWDLISRSEMSVFSSYFTAICTSTKHQPCTSLARSLALWSQEWWRKRVIGCNEMAWVLTRGDHMRFLSVHWKNIIYKIVKWLNLHSQLKDLIQKIVIIG